MKCDLNCPVKIKGTPICCVRCPAVRQHHVSEETREYWSDTTGFYSNDGCRLPRELMPEECKEYDCKEHVFVIPAYIKWEGDKWVPYKCENLKLLQR